MNTLGQSEETFRILVEGVSVMVWSAQSDGFIRYFNAYALAFTGSGRLALWSKSSGRKIKAPP